MELSPQDRELLNLLQGNFPLISRPFARLGDRLSLKEEVVLSRIREWKASGLIRLINAILNSRSLGYQSILVALALPAQELDRAAQAINEHPGVSHNFARDHTFNLWFTLTLPPGRDLASEAEALAKLAGAGDSLMLPALRVFKIGMHFNMTKELIESQPFSGNGLAPLLQPSAEEKRALVALQQDLPLTAAPFALLAQEHDLLERELLETAQSWQESGVIRRYGAVLNHRRAGFQANALVCWAAPLDRVEEVGNRLASSLQVTHCYERPTYPRWPYSIFTMLHAQSQEDCRLQAQALATALGLRDYVLLFSTKQYKMSRVRLLV